jgi:two-component system nitrate/nitrite response regulator NarL
MGIVALLASDDRHAAPSLISDGAAECLLIDARPSEIVQTVWRAARFSPSEEHQQPTLISSINDDNTAVALKSLTKRQAEVLALLIRGNTRATIALTLGIKESTVHVHIKAIYKNLGLNSRSALREWAVSTASLKNCT